MASVTVCSYECYEASSDNAGGKRRKIKKSLIPFMSSCAPVDGTDEVVDDARLDEDGFLVR
ncbi:MAG: hypothetical protein IPP88_24555 [Betaproteobacteria bacterium]|nr:hypothetical protein [Betaproteobacteria bacterium]